MEYKIKCRASDYSQKFSEEHLEIMGFSEWDAEIKIQHQSERTIVANLSARGTGVTIIVAAYNVVPGFCIIPFCYSIPDYKVSGATCATLEYTIHQLAEDMARMQQTEEDRMRVDAVSIGSAVHFLEKILISYANDKKQDD